MTSAPIDLIHDLVSSAADAVPGRHADDVRRVRARGAVRRRAAAHHERQDRQRRSTPACSGTTRAL